MTTPVERDWQVPPAADTIDRKLGWINEGCEEGQWWLKCQRGQADYSKALEVFSGRVSPVDVPAYRSQLNTARLKRNMREVIGANANIRPLWGFSSDNSAFSDQCGMMNKASRAIYLQNFLDQGIKRALQWAGLTSTGWIWPKYHRSMCGWGEGNLTFDTYGAPSVLPVQLPSNHNWQEAYAVHILDEYPVYMAHGMFPDYQEYLQPTQSKFWYSPEIRKSAEQNVSQRMFNRWSRGPENVLSNLYVPVRYSFIIDLTINRTNQMIPMGKIGSSWYYEVPYVGQPLPNGKTADEWDARLYPYRRCMISSEKCIMYDGPAFDWHGEFPGVPICLDDWVWEALGFSLIRDGYEIEKARNEILRGNMDKVRSRLDMALAYDINAVTKNEADTVDPMQPRGRYGFDGSITQTPFVPVVPPEVLNVDPMSIEMLRILDDAEDHQLAIRDVVELAKLRATGGGIDPDKVAAADGPIVRDISRNVERALSDIGGKSKFIILQYYDARRIMLYVGADGVTPETFDYDPTSLVPSHMPDELARIQKPGVVGKIRELLAGAPKSAHSKIERARWFAQNLSVYIVPHSAHEITQMAHKLGLIQLRKAGVLLDSRTIAESWDLDYGTKPEGNTPWERYWDEQSQVMEHALKMKKVADAIQAQGVSPTETILNAVATLGGEQTQEGRPPSGQEAPQMTTKDGGTRTTISESGA